MTVLQALQIIITVAGILCLVGAASEDTIQDFKDEITVHISVILYMVSYIVLLLLTTTAAAVYLKKRSGEKALIIAVAAGLPFLLVRLLYTLIACFAHNASSFNLVSGSVATNLVMAVFQEILVVAIYIITGIKLEVVPKEQQQQGPAGRMAYRTGRGDFGTGKPGLFGLTIAGINELVKFGKEREVPKDEKRNAFPGPAPQYTERPNREDGAGLC